ncbi:KIN17-like protein [Neolecta irregularis DAH-3]|uniref:KIN17-like protein n=1 Tax=Neolecta irregularis (strain DAH-3) TaxID=1198029 RepID=A0A1U7LJE8_NEOID|nr:KIN17-like protein [Neolecta irregularis DAH-3]|eukprot:OLL22769.1 KIN17-like protein [Neolecta irregularis DAH-3]
MHSSLFSQLTTDLANKMKAKGLQRLRWYCQVCEKQCRDENGFRCHVASEGHVRQMLIVGENPRKHIQQYSNQFKHDFLQQLRTSHGEKKVNANHFYQEYISHKSHVHMNGTHWVTLTEFVKHLGREGICKVEQNEKGWYMSWIDNSPESMRRKEIVRKRERLDKGEENRENKLIAQQIERASHEESTTTTGDEERQKVLIREQDEKIKLDWKTTGKQDSIPNTLPVALPKKKQNIFSTVKRTTTISKQSVQNQKKITSTVDQIMQEEIDRKKRFNGRSSEFKRVKI